LALAPTDNVSSLKAGDERVTEPSRPGADSRRARLIGTLVHAVLQHWDFETDPAELIDRLWPSYAMRAGFTDNEIPDEVKGILKAFSGTDAHRELRRATIIGREVPFAMPRPVASDATLAGLPRQTVLEGVLDVLYRHDGRLWIADYKTDRIDPDEAADRAASYRLQADVYRDAARRCLNADVAFKFVFVRTGQMVVAS
jgi:ATP-dependent helicase/nuclease subunit A